MELYDITRYFKHHGLVGEEQVANVMTLICTLQKPKGFIVEAAAGSGKTVLMDIAFGKDEEDTALFPKGYAYFKDAGSETSMHWDSDAINNAHAMVIRELQKDKKDNAIEAIKSLTEGKASTRKVTDVTDKSVKELKISPKTVVASLATENEMKPDAELRRRFITMATDISQEQTERVVTSRARLRWNPESYKCMSEEEVQGMRVHIAKMLQDKRPVKNPFAERYSQILSKFAPDQKIRSVSEHFWDLMDAVTRFNANNRVEVDGAILSSIYDLYMTLDIYKHAFVRDVYGIPPIGDSVLMAFEHAPSYFDSAEKKTGNTLQGFIETTGEQGVWLTINDIRKVMKDRFNIILGAKTVFEICRQLVDSGYLEDYKEGPTYKFQVIDRMKELEMPDKKELLDDAGRKVYAAYDESTYLKWRQTCQGGYTHPVLGEEVEI